MGRYSRISVHAAAPALVRSAAGGLELGDILPDGSWIVVAAGESQSLAALAEQVADACPVAGRVTVGRPTGWEAHVRSLAPSVGVVVCYDRHSWTGVLGVLGQMSANRGPVVLLAETAAAWGDEEAVRGYAQDNGSWLVEITVGDRRLPGQIWRSFRGLATPSRDGTWKARRGSMSKRVLSAPTWTAGDSPVVDPAVSNPMDFVFSPSQGVLSRMSPCGHDPELAEAQGVEVDGASAASVATDIVDLAARGIPAWPRHSMPDATALLDSDLAADVELAQGQRWVGDAQERERLSVRLRRGALLAHATSAGISDCEVSIVLASRRPTFIRSAVAQVAAQRHRRLELVLVAHDPSVAQVGQQALAEFDLASSLLVVDSNATLGDALNQGVEVASGEVVTKWDDDDWYGPDHITDLVLALAYSGAPVVAKAAEFVYLEPLDLTIRRSTGLGERLDTFVAGGTLAMHRDDLREIGGWASVPRAVDSRLVEGTLQAGGAVYRTHGLGVILNRHGHGHTFPAAESWFLRSADHQWSGLALARAGIALDDFGGTDVVAFEGDRVGS